MRLVAVPALVCAFALTVTAFAQPDGSDNAARAAARAIGYEAVEAYEAGDFATALEKFERAYGVLEAPSLGLYSARCMRELGRLVDAAERFNDVTRLSLERFGTGQRRTIQAEAQAAAAKERVELLLRIPKLEIRLSNAPAGTRVEVGGRVVPESLVGAAWPVDPGEHVIRVEWGAASSREVTVRVAEGETREVSLDLEVRAPAPPVESSSAPSPAPEAPAPARVASPAEDRPPPSTTSGRGHRIAGWTTLSLGGAGLLLGGITGRLAIAKDDELGRRCTNAGCPPQVASDIDTYDRLRLMSTAGLVVGAIGAAAGLTLVLTAPRSKSAAQTTLHVGAARVQIRGAF